MSLFEKEFVDNGRCMSGMLAVRFDATHNKVIALGDTGVELIRPDEWLHKDDDGKQTFEENTNYLETKPQICEVIVPNPQFPFLKGDKLFTHYMAWEVCKNGDLLTNEAFIIAEYVFFTIMPDGTFKMAYDNYLGEQVYTPEKARPSGIIYDIGGKKEVLQVKITHIPQNPPKWHTKHPINIGDVVCSCDSYNYEFSLNGKKYIRLRYPEIAGKLTGIEGGISDKINLLPWTDGELRDTDIFPKAFI